jgi:hypothetical protein
MILSINSMVITHYFLTMFWQVYSKNDKYRPLPLIVFEISLHD